ncbi:uncharacterized protein LOC134466154 [Engraulis encrasicolus]|uniref:uncharacterized protein LOC134466154 n=1 Tax=Engraulis encrasicolus TaxID=184585 RepID=UPI002FD41328
MNFKGEQIRHSKCQLVRRPVRGEEREKLAQSLKHQLPRTLHLEKLGSLDEDVFDSGCRDGVPTPGTLKTLSSAQRAKARHHEEDLISLTLMARKEDSLIQQISAKPKSVMLWSAKTIAVFFKRCREDIIYIDATGSIIHRDPVDHKPIYIYEIVTRHPNKGSSPLPVATFATSDHTTPSVSHFVGAFLTDVVRLHGQSARKRPVMLMCDGSIVLLQSLAMNFCGMSLAELLRRYHDLVMGEGKEEDSTLPILHRCLSHVMNNAKSLCKKQ